MKTLRNLACALSILGSLLLSVSLQAQTQASNTAESESGVIRVTRQNFHHFMGNLLRATGVDLVESGSGYEVALKTPQGETRHYRLNPEFVLWQNFTYGDYSQKSVNLDYDVTRGLLNLRFSQTKFLSPADRGRLSRLGVLEPGVEAADWKKVHTFPSGTKILYVAFNASVTPSLEILAAIPNAVTPERETYGFIQYRAEINDVFYGGYFGALRRLQELAYKPGSLPAGRCRTHVAGSAL